MAQTKSEIRELLAGAGIAPLKRFGQHFLIDGNLLRKLVSAAEVGDGDVVLEVGPGTGALTEELLARAGHVVAVEIDKGLYGLCAGRLGDSDRLTLIHSDVLERKSRISGRVLAALADWRERLGGRVMMVANLPYDAATPLLMDLLLGDLRVSPLCCTIQAEVADRLTASAGSKAYGPISVFAQHLSQIRRIGHVPPEAFWPRPEVESTMLRLDVREDVRLSSKQRTCFRDVVHACFNHRRKTMHWGLRRFLDEATLARVEASGRWDLSVRPERVEVDRWGELASFLSD